MIGTLTKDTFDPDQNYDSFYAGHKFEPIPEPMCYEADLVFPRIAWAVDVAKEIGAKNVLDLCCLDGTALLTMASKLDIKATGVDLSEPGILLANKRAHSRDLDAVFNTGAVEDLEPTNAYDLVLLFEAIEHFKDVDRVMQVVKKQLSFDGTLLVSTPDAEGAFGFGNKDACHLRFYTHKHGGENIIVTDHSKPLVSLPDYLISQGFTVIENEVWNDLIHTRAILA